MGGGGTVTGSAPVCQRACLQPAWATGLHGLHGLHSRIDKVPITSDELYSADRNAQ